MTRLRQRGRQSLNQAQLLQVLRAASAVTSIFAVHHRDHGALFAHTNIESGDDCENLCAARLNDEWRRCFLVP